MRAPVRDGAHSAFAGPIPTFLGEALLEASRLREKAQTLFYRALAAQAIAAGDDDASERLNDLHADEQHHLSRLTARLLERSGYRVLAAANGADALDLMKHHEPVDLIVTDAVLPKLDGRALVEELFRKKQAQAALYLSGYTPPASVQHGVLDDGIHFLAKPFTADQLHRAVRRSMGVE